MLLEVGPYPLGEANFLRTCLIGVFVWGVFAWSCEAGVEQVSSEGILVILKYCAISRTEPIDRTIETTTC